jgi:selenocysteine lyase/cysteine desulfurase
VNAAVLRAEFPVLERLAYLNTGTNGPVPRRAVEAALVIMRSQLEEGRGDHRFFDQAMHSALTLRERVAAWLGCERDALTLTHSTTDGVNTVLSGLSLGRGDEVLTSDQEHPGVLVPLVVARERCGFDLRIVPFSEIAGEVGPRTKLVATCHVSWVTGELLEAASIDVPLLLDGAQGLGAIPVDLPSLGCDFYAASGQKWLCGPNGTGYLHVRQDRLEELTVTRGGYGSLADPYDPLASGWQADTTRFASEVPVPHHLAWCLAAMDVLEDFGVERLHSRAADLAESLAGRLRERGLEVAPRGRTTLVSWAADDPEAETQRLAGEGFVVRFLPGTRWVRASVGAWSSEDELDELARRAVG